MARKSVSLSIDELRSICDGLANISTRMKKSLDQATAAGLDAVLLEWSESHWQSFDRMVLTAQKAEGQVAAQALAKSQGRKSLVARMQEKSQRDVARRREREAERRSILGSQPTAVSELPK